MPKMQYIDINCIFLVHPSYSNLIQLQSIEFLTAFALHMNLQLDQYQKIGQSTQIFQFSQSHLELVGSVIRANIVQGSFGVAEIVHTRYDPLTAYFKDGTSITYPHVHRVLITKSSKNRKSGGTVVQNEEQQEIIEVQNNKGEKIDQRIYEEQDDEQLSEKQSSQQGRQKQQKQVIQNVKQRKRKDIRKMGARASKKSDIRKQIRNRLCQLDKKL